MSRYIDADALAQQVCVKLCTESICSNVLKIIHEMPTADVVEVVRCKECIHMGTDKCPSQLNDADFYCCQGERRENGEIH